MQNVSRKSVIFKAAHVVAKKEAANSDVSYKEAFKAALKAIYARTKSVKEVSVEALVASPVVSPVEVCLAKAERVEASSYKEFLDKLPKGLVYWLDLSDLAEDLSDWGSLAKVKERMIYEDHPLFLYEDEDYSKVVMVVR